MIATSTIRAASPEDLDGIMAIERSSFPTDAWSSDAMSSTLRDADTVALVAESAGTLVGYCAVLAPRGGDADVLTIAVASTARGNGIGRRLLVEALGRASVRGVGRAFLEVRIDNPVAQALYASLGFEVVGRRPRYYQPDDVDALVLRLDRLPGGAP